MAHHPDWTGRTVSVDFDGVIHTYASGWTGYEPTDGPEPGAKEFLVELLARGIEPVIVSSRADTPEGRDAIRSWLHLHGFPHLQVTHEKVKAVAYIDDRAIRYDTGSGAWDDVLTQVGHLIGLNARRGQA